MPRNETNDRSVPKVMAGNLWGATVALRPVAQRDFDFAFRLYCETMKGYSAAYVPWDEERQRVSLISQLQNAEVSIITLQDQDIGWQALLETDSSILLGHFYIDPHYQNRGIGTVVLGRLITAANAKAKPLELTVLKNNPARRLYERLGFSIVREDEMKYCMRRPHGV